LKTLLEKSALYSTLLKERMDKGKTALRTAILSESIPKPNAKAKPKPKGKQTRRQSKPGRKRLRVDDDDDSDEDIDAKRAKLDDEVKIEAAPKFKQPDLVTGAKLKDYQLDGVEWMVSLDQNGASGILGMFY
jgi:ATP-dependent DNA helicase